MLPANLEREIEAAALIRNLQMRVRRLETLEQEGCFQLIESQTGATFTTITVPDIYKHLYMVFSVGANVPPVGDSIGLRFNSDAGNNYKWVSRTVTQAAEVTADDGASTFAIVSIEGTTTTELNAGFVLIPDYLNTSKRKSWIAESFSNNYFLWKGGGYWLNTAAIASIDVPGAFYSNSTISLYGLC